MEENHEDKPQVPGPEPGDLSWAQLSEKMTAIDQANQMMWVAHNIERMADRVTNICERTVFIATGELMEMDTDDEEDME